MIHARPADFAASQHRLESMVLSSESDDLAGMVNPEKRLAALLGRALPRWHLSSYVGCRPHEIILKRENNRKPQVVDRRFPNLDFSVSRTVDRVVSAFGIGLKLGVDVETLRPISDSGGLADRYFHKNERRWINAVEGWDRDLRFFDVWVRKEAFVKAVGLGLSIDLGSFAVPMEPDNGIIIPNEGLSESFSKNWHATGLDLGKTVVAALVVSRIPTCVRVCSVTPKTLFG